MSIKFLVDKIVSLIGTLNNPSFFMYRMFHYLNKDVPYSMAKNICKRNIKEYQKNGSSDFIIDTYDGSGQAVHPDIAYLNNRYWMVITPYPYGMEEYENPCIYQGQSLDSIQAPEGPIAFQNKHKPGIHLSDPCFAKNGNKLYCYYRESERKSMHEDQKIWEMQYLFDINGWSEPQLLMSSCDDKILSPAMLFNDNGGLDVFYVSTLKNEFTLVCESLKQDGKKIYYPMIEGLPEDYDLWHIGISKMIDIDDGCKNSKMLAGLFLMRSKQRGGGMKLLETISDNWGKNWHVAKEVEVPPLLQGEMQFPYKSCYIPKGKGSILLSFRDKKSRNRLIIIDQN